MTVKVIDLFCGAGGFSQGVKEAATRLQNDHNLPANSIEVIACVNHDDMAINSHAANHPQAVHFTEDVYSRYMIAHLRRLVYQERMQNPEVIIFIWASLECTNFSKAKGGLPRDADSRTLAECLYYYIEQLDPDVLWIENVEEFLSWGPLDKNGKPVSRKAGEDYLKWRDNLKFYGYNYDYRILNAADYGAFTSRKRYFAQFTRVGLPVIWPEPTHNKKADQGKLPWQPVKKVLDFTDKGQSIFTRKKPLVENSEKRIYAGLIKYVANGDESFLKKYYSGRPYGKVNSVNNPGPTVTTFGNTALVNCEFICQYNGGGTEQRVYSSERPLTSVSTNGRHSLVQAQFIVDYHGKSSANSTSQPSATIATKDKHGLVQLGFLYKYFGNGKNILGPDDPACTVTTKDRMACVWLDKTYGGDKNHQSVNKPAGTVMSNDKHYLMQAFIVKNFSQGGQHNSIEEPAGSILTVPKENLCQTEFLVNPQYNSKGGDLNNPCFTLIARMDKAPPYLVQVKETEQYGILIYPEDSETMVKIKLFMAAYGISDIYMRMLRVDELLAIQGFPEGYILKGTKTQQKKFIGNAVEVYMACALMVSAVLGLMKQEAIAV